MTELKKVEQIIIHCSDSSFGNAGVIDEWHKQRGWSGIGYHYVILNGYPNNSKEHSPEEDGKIEKGRPDNTMGAHCQGRNHNSLGICLIGKGGLFSVKQIKATRNLINRLLEVHSLTWENVHGHYEYSEKTCPDFKIGDLI